MQEKNHHIIQKQLFDLNIIGRQDGYAFQKEVSSLFWEQIHPRLEELFDQLVGPEELVRIDKLEIELDQISLNQFNAEFVEQVVAAIEKRLKEILQKKDTAVNLERMPVRRNRFQLWLDYLEKGYLKWSVGALSDTDLQRAVLETLATERSALEQLKRLLQQNQVAFQRMLYQHDDRFFQHMAEAFTAKKQDELPQLLAEIEQLYLNKDHWADQFLAIPSFTSKQRLRHQYWKKVLHIVMLPSIELSSINLFQAHFQEWFSLSRTQKEAPQVRSILDRLQSLVLKNKATYPLIASWFPAFYKEMIRQFSTTEEPFSEKREGIISDDKLEKMEGENVETDDFPEAEGKEEKERFREKFPSDEIRGIKKEEPAPSDQIEEEGTDTSPIPTELEKDALVEKAGSDKFGDTEVEDAGPPKAERVLSDEKITPDEIEKAEKLDILEDVVEEENITRAKKDSEEKKTEDEAVLPPGLESRVIETASPQLPTIGEWLDQYPDLNLQDGTYFYIQNAGVILIHPFLPAFFKNLKLVEKGQFVNDPATQKAVHLIWYLATGTTNPTESDLVLPKFLCGVPLNYPLERRIEITTEDQEEANNLLQAVIDHWQVLKSTSPDGLREGFLQRDGKLELRQGSWYLQVEQKAIDVLLDRLPWNLSIIKLSWMLEMLKVEWA